MVHFMANWRIWLHLVAVGDFSAEVRETLDSIGSGGEGGIRTPGTAFDRTTV